MNPWFSGMELKPSAKVSLVCFGSAGSGGTQFRAWNRLTPDWLRVLGAQLPGREVRHRETMLRDLDAMVGQIVSALRDVPGRIAFFGHSFGALLAFEATRRLRAEGRELPCWLFVAGRAAPHLPHAYRKTYHLPDGEFIEVLRQYGGTDSRILDETHQLQFFLPAIRADLEINTEYVHERSARFPVPITAVRGFDDPVCSRAELQAWEEMTTAPLDLHEWEGAHFFYKESQHRLLATFFSRLEMI